MFNKTENIISENKNNVLQKITQFVAINLVEILNVSSKDTIETNPKIDQRQSHNSISIQISGKCSLFLFNIAYYIIIDEIFDLNFNILLHVL